MEIIPLTWLDKINSSRKTVIILAVLALFSGIGTYTVFAKSGATGPNPDVVLGFMYLNLGRSTGTDFLPDAVNESSHQGTRLQAGLRPPPYLARYSRAYCRSYSTTAVPVDLPVVPVVYR